MAESMIRDHIKALNSYEPIVPFEVLSQKTGIAINDLVKLDANENPYGMPPSAIKRLANLNYGHIYPDPESRQLRKKLADFAQMPIDNIIVGSGADELIDLIVRLTMDPGDKLIDCPPTFGFYDAVAQINNLERLEVPRKPDFSLDLEGIKNAALHGAKLIFLANPNNPDGSITQKDILNQILQLPLLVVVDEAYIEFAERGFSMAKAVLNHDNLIVLRTFSKWGGLAGLRLGYGIVPSTLQKELMKIKQPYNVSVAASEAGLGALDDFEILTQRLAWIKEERSRLFSELEKISWLKPYPTQANFILCRVNGMEARKLKTQLADRGIIIRYFNKPGLEDHVRFSIGKSEDTDQLINALKEMTP